MRSSLSPGRQGTGAFPEAESGRVEARRELETVACLHP
jgi:hypothetical protein